MTRIILRQLGRLLRWFETRVDPFAPRDDGTPPRDMLPYMRSQLAPFGKAIPIMAGVSLVVAVVEVALIMYTGRLVDLMSDAGVADFWVAHGLEVGIIAALALFARPFLFALHHMLLEQTLAANMQENVRWRAHKHMLGQSMTFFQNDFAGRLANRVMQQGPAVEDNSYMLVEALWFAAIYVIAAGVAVAAFDLRLVVPLLIWLTVYIAYSWWIAVRVAEASEKWSDGRSMVTGRVVDAYTNMETVKLFADVEQEERYALSAMRRLRLRWMRFLRLMTEMHALLVTINGILIVGVIGAALWLWTAQAISIGEVAAASGLVMRLNGMSGWIMWVTIRLFENTGTIREGLRSISVDHDVVDAPGAPALKVSRGEIAIHGLTHHYGKGQGGLDNLSTVIAPGEKVGLVGRSGAGKSSLVNLLLRFRDPESGRIEIDAQDISTVTQTSLRKQIGMVTQDSSLLHRSIRANLLYGRPEATEAQVLEAARQAAAHDFILGLEDPKGRAGYDAHVGERGVKLSGGQRQRIALARVILKDAPILVLDEATSALDSEVEAQIQETLHDLMQGKTVIAIAHRLSTIAQMDRILVMDRGHIVEQGSHDALLSANGLYASLWARQSGGFIGREAAE